MKQRLRRLGQLALGERAVIVSVNTLEEPALGLRLMQMGFVKGTEVELARQAPLTSDPIAVRLRGSLVALRRAEANLVEVE